MRTTTLAVFVALLAAVATAAADTPSDIVDGLNQRLRGKVITLRQADAADRLRFNSVGERIGEVKAGLWSLDSMLEVESVTSKRNGIRVEGKRVVLSFDWKNGKFIRSVVGNSKRIDIEVPKANATIKGMNQALGRIFVHGPEKLSDIAPDYWRDCFEEGGMVQEQGSQGPDWRCRDKSGRRFSSSNDLTPREFPGLGMVYRVGYEAGGTKVSVPTSVSTPDPDYPEIARQAKYQGTTILWVIVDRDGSPKLIRIVRPLGLGMDDAAARTVEKWHFQPDMKGSEPVPVQIMVEVNFHLH